MIIDDRNLAESPLRAAVTNAYRMNEAECIELLLKEAALPAASLQRIHQRAEQLVVAVRDKRMGKGGLDAFLYQYDLSNEEGIALMCLSEALLRVPDKITADRLIKDKILSADWELHAGKSDSMFVNATTWGLMLTGKVYNLHELPAKNLHGTLKKLTLKGGEPVIRKMANYAMKILGRQFVMGRSIKEALKRARELESIGYRYSYDMLGEAAYTAEDAARYFEDYKKAIIAIGKGKGNRGPIESPGISVKLSALHPRYEFSHQENVMQQLVPRLKELAVLAKKGNIGFTVDAEEADRLDLSLDVIKAVFCDSDLDGWEGFGLAVQSYQKRAFYLLDYLADLAKRKKKRMMLRLIKGAYWDSEIKVSQVEGFRGYPVFTRKASTDTSFLACAKKVLAKGDAFYPQFATHNAYSVAAIMEMVGSRRDFEFQCLHGMGQSLYDEVVGKDNFDIPCRIYAPVGSHEELLPYLVRRLLENGANSSFVNRIVDAKAPVSEIIADPVKKVWEFGEKQHPNIPLPANIYGDTRVNSKGMDLTNRQNLQALKQKMLQHAEENHVGAAIIAGEEKQGEVKQVYSPIDRSECVGQIIKADVNDVETAIVSAQQAFTDWSLTPAVERAACLNHAADLFEQNMEKLMTVAVREAGKTIADAVAEVREAVDFCRYYAEQAIKKLADPIVLPGPTGEENQLSLHGRGVIVCISPWNFPLAIFVGQVTAALAAGNTVLAKPAEQTSLIAYEAVQLLYQAGIPKNVLQLLIGRGSVLGGRMVEDPRIAGVMFTGSTETARLINKSLANKQGPIVPFIAETGGQNAMIVDSSALPEQIVRDVCLSSFGSAGQRCSALRVLFLQEDIADKVTEMLSGAMAELTVGHPGWLATDVGPVIDAGAQKILQDHFERMSVEAKLIYQITMPEKASKGSFFAPCAFEIDSLNQLTEEVFGPILHIVRYKAEALDQVIDDINQTGFGLTLGVHSRIDETVEYIKQRVRVGNIYVNRSMTGAVVGVQPFGGEGLSGTGPKAGGPHYLLRLSTERSLSVDTTAAGGNATLMSLEQ